MRFAHKGLRALYKADRPAGLPQTLVPGAAAQPTDLDIPGYRLHALKGPRAGYWSLRVSGNWRIVFRFDEGEPVDVDLVDYH